MRVLVHASNRDSIAHMMQGTEASAFTCVQRIFLKSLGTSAVNRGKCAAISTSLRCYPILPLMCIPMHIQLEQNQLCLFQFQFQNFCARYLCALEEALQVLQCGVRHHCALVLTPFAPHAFGTLILGWCKWLAQNGRMLSLGQHVSSRGAECGNL